uniref:Integrase zinc-binding domain-containing protein n=1 Tax=Populus alba TaxID=43335 RepID=A0A4U5QWZ7_POPAL|nr:hypothetical protein D5086_0000042410 [Populus alba]
MGFDFAVEYRAGKHNTVADALSRCLEDHPCLTSISMPLLPLFNLIRLEIKNSDQLQLLLCNIRKGEAVGSWEFKDGLLFFKRRVYLLHTSPLVPSIIAAIHDSAHEGYQKTLHRVAQDFYWQGMKASIQTFGELQPLPKAILDSRCVSQFQPSVSPLGRVVSCRFFLGRCVLFQ